MLNTLPFLAEIPSAVLIGLAILFFYVGKAVPAFRKLPVIGIFALVSAIGFALSLGGGEPVRIFYDMIQVDSFARMYNQIYLIAAVVMALMVLWGHEMSRENDWENAGLVSTMLLGLMFMSSTVDLLMAVVAIELVSLPSYMLVALNKKNPASKEASLKYVLFGSFATAVMLYGVSLIFGLTGSLKFDIIWNQLDKASLVGSPIFLLAITMTLGGMAFKIAAAPFHFWCPDAYQAAPTPVTAFLSVAPKVGGVALMMRFFSSHGPLQGETLTNIVIVISILTMTIGNFAALKQKDIKRLLAYSSISHAGFLLMGIAVMNQEGRQAVFFYIPIYLLMNLGAFMAIIYMSKGQKFQITDYKGMIQKNPLLTVVFAICMLSLAGVPPFAGFIGKFYLFKVVMTKGLFPLAIAAGINSVVGLYYYVNVLKVMIIDEPDNKEEPAEKIAGPVWFVVACSVPLTIFGVYWNPLVDWASAVILLG